MKKYFCIWILALVLFFACFHTWAFADSILQDFQVRPWAVGQMVKYQTDFYTDNLLARTETTTYSIVDQETINDKNYFWLEIEDDKGDGAVITQKIQVQQPEPMDFENFLTIDLQHLNARRKIMGIAIKGSRPIPSFNEHEISSSDIAKAEAGSVEKPSVILTLGIKSKPNYIVTTNQLIDVKAGNFNTYLFHFALSNTTTQKVITDLQSKPLPVFSSENSDDWGSPRVPICGLVQRESESKEMNGSACSRRVELIAFSDTGAVSKVKYKPRWIPLSGKKQKSESVN
jgi:hypothetical protein